MDRLADGRAAQHRGGLQAQGVAAAAVAGYLRPSDRRPLGARGVRHPPGRPADQPGHRLRRARARLRPRDAGGGGQCAGQPRDGRHAVRLPADVQQLHGRERRGCQPRRLGVGIDGSGAGEQYGEQHALAQRLRHRATLPPQVGAHERRGRLRAVEEPDRQPPVRGGRG